MKLIKNTLNFFKTFESIFECKYNYTSFDKYKQNNNNNKPNILIMCTFSVFGGIEMHCLSFYKHFKKNGYNVQIIIPNNSILEKKFTKERLPFYSYKKSKIFKPNRQPGLKKIISNIIKKHNINIVHCNRAKDTHLLKGIQSKVKLIFTRHAPSLIRNKYMKQFDAIMGVNKNFIKKAKEKFPKKIIIPITPFFLDDESLNFIPNTTKQEFFKKEFNIELPSYPTIIQIASLTNVKNHTVLLNAIYELIHKKKKPVNVLLCGDGYNKIKLQKLSKKLNIQNYIYFLGFTDKRIEVTYHSDIKILTSKSEGHPISLMEAALLKKPLIGPTNTGVVNTIKHKKTGLLFENNNSNDLVKKIEELLDNPEQSKTYGKNAFDHVKNNFIADILIKKLELLHKQVLKN